MDATAGGSQTNAALYFDNDPSLNAFVLLNGQYQISLWAKAASSTSPTVTITANRGSSGGFSCGPYTPTLTGTWTQYIFTCNTSETSSTTVPGTATFNIKVTGGAAYVDNLDFEKAGADPGNPTAFRDPIISLLRQYYATSTGGPPGLLRDWLNQNGTTLDNWIQPDFSQEPDGHGAGYYIGPGGSNAVDLSLPDYLNIVKAVGAVPYLEVPVTFTTTDAANLIEFLASPSSTTYGAKRAALGQVAPWTSVFPTIHLSFCNECWNGQSFAGQNLADRSNQPNGEIYYDYSSRARDIFSAMRGDSYYASSSFDLGMNTQTALNYTMDTAIARAHPDSIEMEAYTYGTIFNASSDAQFWGPALAEPYEHVTDPTDPRNIYQDFHDYQSQNTCGATGTAQCKVSIYEWGEGTIAGTINQTLLNEINAGAGQGVAMPLQFLLFMQDYDIVNQNFFAFAESINGSAISGETSKLWGNFVDAGGETNNVRPEFLGVSLANQSVIGPMYSCPISNSVTYNFATSTNGGVGNGMPAMSNVPYVYPFCFENGNKRSLVLINTDLSNGHSLVFAGTNIPAGTVTQRQYAPSSPDLMNEGPTPGSLIAPATVAIATSSLFSPASITLPPDSVTALDYTASLSPAPPTTTITSPANNATVSGTITVTATASATSSTILSQEQLYADGILEGTDVSSSSPYTFSLNTTLFSNGTHILVAEAYDATGNVGTSTAITITVNNVGSAPSISSFSASPATVAFNGTSTLSWSVSGATSLSISPTIGTVTGSSVITPSLATTTVFTLSATNSNGTVTATTSVTVTPYTIPNAPTGISAVAGNAQATISFTSGSNGGSSIIYYTATSNPSNISATSTASPIIVHGLTNGQSYTFTVTATNAAGVSASSSLSSSVTPSNLNPVIGSFLVAPAYIMPGASSTLSWTTTFATTVSLNQGLGNQSATSTGSVVVSPSSTTLYTLTATNVNGSSTAQATVVVDGTPPSVPQGLTATAVSQGEIDLAWSGSTDNVSVLGYTIFQNGILIATTSNLSYANTGLLAGTSYGYTVDAFDAAGNVSGQSASASATTQTASSGGGGGGSSGGSGGSGGGGGGYVPPVIPDATTSGTTKPTTTITMTTPTTVTNSVTGNSGTFSGSGIIPIIEDIRSLSLRMFLGSDNGQNLSIGSTGQNVWALQVYLAMNNILTPTGSVGSKLLNPTGYFGTLTKEALAGYQLEVGITPASGLLTTQTINYFDSIADGNTSTTMITPSQKPPLPSLSSSSHFVSPNSNPSAQSLLFFGSRGVGISAVQNILLKEGFLSAGIFTKGLFDAATLRAVETFQCTNNIACSGIGYGVVGPRTRAALGI
jgi:hypothetical protein